MPLAVPAMSIACHAVSAGMPRQAPASSEIAAGSFTAWFSGSTMYSAAVPNGRFHCAFQVHTRSPTRDFTTPSPTMSISPAPSLCGITRGNAILRVKPARFFTSDGLTPEVLSLMRTSPGPGFGVSISPTCSTSFAVPFFSYQAASIVIPSRETQLSSRPSERGSRAPGPTYHKLVFLAALGRDDKDGYAL